MKIMSTDEKGNTKYFCNICEQPNRLVKHDGTEIKMECRCLK